MSNFWYSAAIPKSFNIRQDFYRCRGCGVEFSSMYSDGNDLVKFLEDGGQEVRWLPTFEEGGYLDLLERLVKGYDKSQQITMQIAKSFESEFKKIVQLSEAGKTFSVAIGCRCPNCLADNSETVEEKVLNSPQLEWIKYKPI
jgi:hypothetical protein